MALERCLRGRTFVGLVRFFLVVRCDGAAVGIKARLLC